MHSLKNMQVLLKSKLGDAIRANRFKGVGLTNGCGLRQTVDGATL